MYLQVNTVYISSSFVSYRNILSKIFLLGEIKSAKYLKYQVRLSE